MLKVGKLYYHAVIFSQHSHCAWARVAASGSVRQELQRQDAYPEGRPSHLRRSSRS